MLNQESLNLIQNLKNYRGTNKENAKITSENVRGQGFPKINQTCKNITISPIMVNGKLKLCKKDNQQEDEEMLIRKQEIWGKEQKQEKMQDYKRNKQNKDLDTLTAIAAILLLFVLAFHLAPNQHYSPQN